MSILGGFGYIEAKKILIENSLFEYVAAVKGGGLYLIPYSQE